MRSLSGLYFFLRIVAFLSAYLSQKISHHVFDVWFPLGTVCLITALTIAFIRPYKQTYMNYLDALLLSNFALLAFVISSEFHVLLAARILFLTPIAMFFMLILRKFQLLINFKALSQKCYNCCRLRALYSTQTTAEERQALLIQPT